MRACLCAVMVLATAAQAEVAPTKAAAGFDTIYNVPRVQGIAFGPGPGMFHAAVSPIAGPDGTVPDGTVSDIVQWHLDPIRLGRTWSSDTLVSDLAISPGGLVYAAGQRGGQSGATGAKKGAEPRSGSVISVDPGDPAGSGVPVKIISYSGAKDIIAISRFNQAAFDGEGRLYLTAPTQFSVTILPDSQAPLKPGTNLPRLVLTCGAPAQFSVFSAGGQPAYVASTTDGALLETGFVNLGAADIPPSGCFRVTNVFGYEKAPPTLNSVVHAVLTNAAGQADAVLVLEPNTGILHLLRLDGATQQLSRADWTDLEASTPGTLTLLAASADGTVIFVGGHGSGEILRFRREGDRLVRAGTLRTGDGLEQIEVSPDGAYAALVMRDPKGLDRIHLIRAPGALGEGAQAVPTGGETLRRIQSELNRLGLAVGPADGIPGRRTITGIDRLVEQNNHIESGGFDLESMIEGVFLTRPAEGRSY